MIAIVDDCKDSRRALARWLQLAGFQTIELSSVRHLCQFLGSNEVPRLILLDLMMPVTGGLECLTLLRENLLWKFIPVVMLSGCSDQASVDEAMRLGAVDYLIKGHSWDEILLKVKEYISIAA